MQLTSDDVFQSVLLSVITAEYVRQLVTNTDAVVLRRMSALPVNSVSRLFVALFITHYMQYS